MSFWLTHLGLNLITINLTSIIYTNRMFRYLYIHVDIIYCYPFIIFIVLLFHPINYKRCTLYTQWTCLKTNIIKAHRYTIKVYKIGVQKTKVYQKQNKRYTVHIKVRKRHTIMCKHINVHKNPVIPGLNLSPWRWSLIWFITHLTFLYLNYDFASFFIQQLSGLICVTLEIKTCL